MKLKQKPNTTKESVHWLNQTSTSSNYTALLEEESEDQQHKPGPENTPKPLPIYITEVTNNSSLMQLLKHIAIQQYEVKTLADNRVKVQPKTSESYRIIIKALAEKNGISHLKIKKRNKL
jgi:hypothetical protein